MTGADTRFIAVEGIDASGKSTQTDLLADRLRADGLTVEVRSFPRYGSFFGERIRALLDGHRDGTEETAHTLDPRSMALWFAMDRWQSFRDPVRTDVVLLNRYTLSNAVYQASRLDGPAGDELFGWILELEHGVLGLPRPHLTVVLDLDVAASSARASDRAGRSGDEPDVYERSMELLAAARHRYVHAGDHVPGLHVVRVGNRGADEVAADVWRLAGLPSADR